MDKQQIISFIKSQMDAGRITSQELASLAAGQMPIANPRVEPVNAASVVVDKVEKKQIGFINALYLIGTIIVMIGIIILMAQHWQEIGFLGRVIVTVGVSFAAYAIGLFSGRKNSLIQQAMFALSAALAPLGAYVILDNLGVSFNSSNQALTALAIFIIFLAAQIAVRNEILVIVMVGYGTWAYYAFLANILSVNLYSVDWVKWSTLIVGLSYIAISYGYETMMRRKTGGFLRKEMSAVTNVLYGLGTLAFLAAAISFGGIWDFLMILFIFAAFYGSIYLHSRSMLFFAAVFLVAHVIKLTTKYFVGSIGWPVALIICGVLIIAIGYGSITLNNRYFKPAR